MTRDEALLALRQPVGESWRPALYLSRDEPQDEELWRAALHFWVHAEPHQESRALGNWLGQTLRNCPQRGPEALEALFARLGAPHREGYLYALREALAESRFTGPRRWLATQGATLTRLASDWPVQPPWSSAYESTRHAILAYAATFLPLLPPADRASLALNCLRALLVHRQPPSHRDDATMPQTLRQALPRESWAELAELLRQELPQVRGLDLRPYARKHKRLAPTGGLQLCLDVLETLLEHPDWRLDPVQLEQAELTRVCDLLPTRPNSRLARPSGQSLRDYLAGLPPLDQLLV